MLDLIRENKYFVSKDCSLVNFLQNNCLFFSVDIYSDLVKKNLLLLNGEFITSLNISLFTGDELILKTPESFEPSINSNYELLYEDDYLFVVNKPSMLPIHPAGKYYFHTLTHLLFQDGVVDSNSLFPVNRLDKETSGLVLFAKSSELASKLQSLFLKDCVEKIYEAIVFGKTELDFIVDAPLLKKTVGDIRDHMVVDSTGFPSKTSIHTLASSDEFSYLEVKLYSGRRHQIRAHLAHVGYPLVGDKQYGSHPDLFIKFIRTPSLVSDIECILLLGALRQLLHCKKLAFFHPITGKKLTFEAILPKDMLYFINKHLN
jgi:RluA family pseudouridine synthase